MSETFKKLFFGKNTVQALLAVMWSIAAIVYVFTTTFCEIPEPNVRIADTTQGFVLGTIIAGIINYFFGSSKSSADKTELLKNNEPANNGN